MTPETARFLYEQMQTIKWIIVGAIIYFFLLSPWSPVWGSPQCMTYKEARAQWPTKHLYWSTKNRCWHDGRYTRRTFDARPHYAAVTTTPKTDADFCCWPDLPRDANGAIVEPPKPFADRWLQTLDVWRYQ